jgi:hypothetical protein
MERLRSFSIFSFFWSKRQEERGPRVYKQMAITPEAHARIVARADKRGDSIIDYVDKLVGVR